MPFVKGQSGNPGGKVPITLQQRQFTAWCQETAIKKVMKKVDEFLDSNNKDHQKWAAEIVLERAFGKPIQLNQNENYEMAEVKTLTDAELKAKALELINVNSTGNSQGTGIPTIQ
jgi:hypothetical protein